MKYILSIVSLFTSLCYGQIYFNTIFDINGMPEVYEGVVYNSSDSSFSIHGNATADNKPYIIKININGNVIDTTLVENIDSNSGYSSSICTDFQQNIITAGYQQHVSGSSTGFMAKINEQGDTIWTLSSDSLGNADGFSSVAIINDSNYVVSGARESFSNGLQDFWLLKLDTGGNIIWQNYFGGVDIDYALNVDTIVGGGFVIGGFTKSYGAGENDIYIVKTDANGNFLWHKWYGLSSYDSGQVKSLSSGHFLVYGAYSYINPNNTSEIATHAIIMELDENGDQVWFKEYSQYVPGSPSYYLYNEAVNSVIIVQDGYVFSGVVQDTSVGGMSVGWILKIDFSGNELWSRKYWVRPSANYFYDIVKTENNFVLTGFVWPENGSQTSDGWIVRTNCLGFDGPPAASGTPQSDDNNTVVVQNSSQRFGDGIIYWGDGDSTIFTEFDDTLLYHTYASSGVYTIELIVNACTESDTVYLNANATPLGIEELNCCAFELYPNPAQDQVLVKYNVQEPATIVIYDLNGKVLYQSQLSEQQNELLLDLTTYDHGVYVVNMMSLNGEGITKKLLVQ